MHSLNVLVSCGEEHCLFFTAYMYVSFETMTISCQLFFFLRGDGLVEPAQARIAVAMLYS